jgi:hypothetical protein
MKRLLILLFAITILVSLTGCGNKQIYYAEGGYFTIQNSSEDSVFTKAFNEAKDNYTIKITSGIYTIKVPLISDAKNLLIEGDPTQPPIIKGFAFIAGNDGWIFRNLILLGGIGIDMSNSKNWVLENVIINGITYNETGSGLGDWER